jgi:hypothetical protein
MARHATSLGLVEPKATADKAERYLPHAATSATAQIKAPPTACFG